MTDQPRPKDTPTPEETRIWVAMNRLTRRIQAEISAELKAAGLPPLKWYDVLWSIERRGGALRPNDLEADVVFEQSSLSHLSKRLIAEGLLEAVSCETDRRGKVLQITPKGRDIRAKMWGIYGPRLHEMMAPIAKDPGWEGLLRAADLADWQGKT
ncbi:MarR family winged helix-turn-helix transcriptional regulator [Phaeobacter sp.]|uniref:MarR family winged helix-turn-helix transcriptional regulator n=1 Tax=Phaeobacter sp. TaxID=1902409 RepID=UPI0025FA2B68|nr:MarR family winged helix-turn-helix transcriptional regulator [Phaeobacter sp.]